MKKLNSTDIAKIAGVSRSTVSRVVNGYSNVPAETKAKVMKVIDEYSYYPMLSGQLLVGKKNRTIGLFWIHNTELRNCSIANDSLTSSFFMYVTEAAAQQEYLVLSCLVSDLNDPKNINWIKSIFMQGRIDGGIFIGTNNHEPLIEELIGLGKVIGVFDHYKEGVWEPNRISVNFDRDTGEKVIDYVYSMGHTKIAIIDGDLRRFSTHDRHTSYLKGLVKYNIPIKDKWMCYGGITVDTGYEAALKMLESCNGDYPTAICANNDGVAFGTLRAIQEHDPRLLDKISVVGIDGHPDGKCMTPKLSTFGFDFKNMFFSLVNRTIDAIEEKKGVLSTEFVETFLVDGDSCFPPIQNNIPF